MSTHKKEAIRTLSSNVEQALPMLLKYKEEFWLNHCNFILNDFLLPWARRNLHSQELECDQYVILIENRIDNQWLFTVLNTLLMSPPKTGFCLITDKQSQKKAQSMLQSHEIIINNINLVIDEIFPGTYLSEKSALNKLMKNSIFWEKLPHERLLMIQTDALLSEPLPRYFFDFNYLGAPFLPRQNSEYFENHSDNGEIINFFKVETPIHGSPNKEVYPHLYGNGGLSIRNRSVMKQICEEYGTKTTEAEQEDVFFSRHLNKVFSPEPIHIAKAFAFESTYNKSAIGSHAAWKYLNNRDLAEYFEKHLKKVWSMVNT